MTNAATGTYLTVTSIDGKLAEQPLQPASPAPGVPPHRSIGKLTRVSLQLAFTPQAAPRGMT